MSANSTLLWVSGWWWPNLRKWIQITLSLWLGLCHFFGKRRLKAKSEILKIWEKGCLRTDTYSNKIVKNRVRSTYYVHRENSKKITTSTFIFALSMCHALLFTCDSIPFVIFAKKNIQYISNSSADYWNSNNMPNFTLNDGRISFSRIDGNFLWISWCRKELNLL